MPSVHIKKNDQVVIIKNNGVNPVQGIFAGFPEGATISLSPSQQLKISYQGGTNGHDVILTQIVAPSARTSATAYAGPMLACDWKGHSYSASITR